ncbi:MAG: starch-binding protein [Ruminococcus sp.]|nr:starch-binding protein [Ruminococcus sp.]
MKKRLAAVIAVLVALSTFSVNAEITGNYENSNSTDLASGDEATPGESTPEEPTESGYPGGGSGGGEDSGEGSETRKFADTLGWEDIYCYAFNFDGEENAAWPGVKMEGPDYDDFGTPQYYTDISEKYTYVIFSSGDNQSPQLDYYPGILGYYSDGNNFYSWSAEGGEGAGSSGSGGTEIDPTEPGVLPTEAPEATESTVPSEVTESVAPSETTEGSGEGAGSSGYGGEVDPTETDLAEEAENQSYLYLENAQNLENVYCYAFNDNGAENAPYPGVPMEGKFSYGNSEFYRTLISDKYTHVMFVYKEISVAEAESDEPTIQSECLDYNPEIKSFYYHEGSFYAWYDFEETTPSEDTTFPTKTPDKETKPRPTTVPCTAEDTETVPPTTACCEETSAPDCTEPCETTRPPQTNPKPTEKPTKSPSVGPPANTPAVTPASRPVIPRLNILTGTMSCGKTLKLIVLNKGNNTVKFSSSNKKIARVNQKGIVTALKKGFAKITAQIGANKRYFTLKVVSSPTLDRKSIKIKKGKSKKILIYGKAPGINLKFKSTKKAKIISRKTVSYIKVKAKRAGKTKIKVRVNGKWLKLKVKVI